MILFPVTTEGNFSFLRRPPLHEVFKKRWHSILLIILLVSPVANAITIDFSGGSSALDGPDGNIRTFSAGPITVNTSAFSRDDAGAWSEAYLVNTSGGLGVTDSSEGDGDNGLYRVDNVGRDNYVLFEFSMPVIVDRIYLDDVLSDSDATIWIGSLADPFNNHITLSDAVLSSLLREQSDTTVSTARFADINASEVVGNVLVVASSVSDPTPEDRFVIGNMVTAVPEPTTLALMGLGLAGFGYQRRRKDFSS